MPARSRLPVGPSRSQKDSTMPDIIEDQIALLVASWSHSDFRGEFRALVRVEEEVGVEGDGDVPNGLRECSYLSIPDQYLIVDVSEWIADDSAIPAGWSDVARGCDYDVRLDLTWRDEEHPTRLLYKATGR